MGRWARGNKAWGECQKTGRRMLINNMVRDGYYKVIVDPRAYDPPEPTERPIPVVDAIAINNPAPDVDRQLTVITYPLYDVVRDITLGALLEIDNLGNNSVPNYGVAPVWVTDLGAYMVTDAGAIIVFNVS